VEERRRFAALAACLVTVVALSVWPVLSSAGREGGLANLLATLFVRSGHERLSGYFTLVDQAGNILLQTGLAVAPGDLFIDAANRVHRVVSIDGDIAATAEVPDDAELPPGAAGGAVSNRRLWLSAATSPFSYAAPPTPLGIPLGAARNVVVIYHTHSDESYIPTSGTSSIAGNGGVYAVGDALAGGLRSRGFTIVHDRATHDPHDAGAYPRSRRTVLRNLKFGPTFLFDVHRDSAPAEAYLTEVGGVTTSSILIVVGGANPLVRSNLATARRLKLFADELHPGLVRGIYVARGNYNQDLDPGAILLEVGTEYIPRELAERSSVLFSEAVAAFTGRPGPDNTTTPR